MYTKRIKRALERTQKIKLEYEHCTLDELIWIQKVLESGHKFQDETSTTSTTTFSTFFIAMLTFYGSSFGMYVNTISNQSKTFTGDDKQKTLTFLQNVVSFINTGGQLVMVAFLILLVIVLFWMLRQKVVARDIHLRLLIVKELIERKQKKPTITV